MIDTIYIEEEFASHPRVEVIRRKYPKASMVAISRYGEVFNRGHQSFRLQKRRPSLILARKRGNLLMPAPYGVGAEHNFYFSHVLNCLYDCRYCFLQGMYRSAHYVLFVNYEEFQDAMVRKAGEWPKESICCFSGYDGDSLVLEPITGFLESFLPFFSREPRLELELRTKSVAIRPLLDREAFPGCVVAFSFTPESVGKILEHGVPALDERLAAAAKLAARGWRIGLRFDPLVYTKDHEELYRDLFRKVFEALPSDSIHSVGFGAFRLPRDYFHRMARLYPEERLFASPLEEREGMVSYVLGIEEEMKSACRRMLLESVPEERLFSY
ncbi:MAG: spore photoproduct lyase family protein [Vicinamibacteria bacterium]